MKPTKEPLGESDNHCQFALIIKFAYLILCQHQQWTPKEIYFMGITFSMFEIPLCFFFGLLIIPLVGPSEAPIFRDPV